MITTTERQPCLSTETKRILKNLIDAWECTGRGETDLADKQYFYDAAALLTKALSGTHEDIRKVIPLCPAYPKGGRFELQDLADAERDGKKVVITEKDGGRHSWAIQ